MASDQSIGIVFMLNKTEKPETRELLLGIQLRMKDHGGVHIRNVLPDRTFASPRASRGRVLHNKPEG